MEAEPNAAPPNDPTTSDIVRRVSDDSFDEVKGDPIDMNMEPVFSTASGIPIGVKAESLEKSKYLFQQDNSGQTSSSSSSKPRFSSPITKSGGGKQFVSPFSSSTPKSLKRPPTSFVSPLVKNDDGAPPPKKAAPQANEAENQVEMLDTSDILPDLVGKVVRIEDLKLVLLLFATSTKILVICNPEEIKNIQLFDRIQLKNAKLSRKSPDGNIEKVTMTESSKILNLLKNEDFSIDEEHSFAEKPYTREPSFIYELQPTKSSTQMINQAVLKVNIVDLNPRFYKGCSACKYRFSSSSLPDNCPNCGEVSQKEKCAYSLMRIADYSGQLKVHVTHETMIKFLNMLGYMDIEEMDRFSNLEEQRSSIFKPVFVKIERSNDDNEVWTALDFAHVDWIGYSEWLERRLDHL